MKVNGQLHAPPIYLKGAKTIPIGYKVRLNAETGWILWRGKTLALSGIEPKFARIVVTILIEAFQLLLMCAY
jgi:hypothetical protein